MSLLRSNVEWHLFVVPNIKAATAASIDGCGECVGACGASSMAAMALELACGDGSGEVIMVMARHGRSLGIGVDYL